MHFSGKKMIGSRINDIRNQSTEMLLKKGEKIGKRKELFSRRSFVCCRKRQSKRQKNVRLLFSVYQTR